MNDFYCNKPGVLSPFPCVGACLLPPKPAGNCLFHLRLFNTPEQAQFSLLHFLLDVKPSNVLINKEGHVKMCDFGISGYLVDSVAKTMDAGCKPYMAVSATLCSLSPDCERLLLRNQSVPPPP